MTELESSDLIVIHKDKESNEIKVSPLDYDREKLQGVVRACPEAFFAKKVIVCEGATEVGICRALDRHRKAQTKDLMSFKDTAYVDGTGSSFAERADELKTLFDVSVLCDSDRDTNPSKDELAQNGISIFDCEDDLSIEKQVFKDLPWDAVLGLLDYVKVAHKKSDDQIETAILAKFPEAVLPQNWRDQGSENLRDAIAKASMVERDRDHPAWFKRIDHGEKMGDVIFNNFDVIGDDKRLKSMLTGLSDWIDADGL